MEEYQKRVIDEAEELDIKIGKLEKFIENPPINIEVIGDQDHEDFEYCGEIVFNEERNLG